MMNRITTLPLAALRAFEAAFRLGSLKAAAVELGVTPAAVSHQVKALEIHLGTALFERLHRALRPTRAGRTTGDRGHGRAYRDRRGASRTG